MGKDFRKLWALMLVVAFVRSASADPIGDWDFEPGGSLANGGEAAPQGNGTLVGNAAIVTDGGNSYLSITEADGWVDVGGDRDPGQDPPT